MKTTLLNQDSYYQSHQNQIEYKNNSIGPSTSFNTSLLASYYDFLKIMAEQLVADVLEIEGEEESLTPIEDQSNTFDDRHTDQERSSINCPLHKELYLMI